MIITSNARLVIATKTKINPLTGALDLTSVVLPICFQDTIVVEQFGSAFMDIVHYASPSLHISEKPIVDTALKILRAEYRYSKTYGVKIYKNIPTGHGLGSGASNAMAVIKAVARYEKLKIDDERLFAIAKNIGADAPFFAKNKPAIYEHNNQVIRPLNVKLNPHILLLIHPQTIEKRDVIEAFIDQGLPTQKTIESIANAAEGASLTDLGKEVFNELEEIVIKKIPELRDVLTDLKRNKVEVSGIAGAGSTIFALSHDRNLLKYIADKYRKRNYQIVFTKICK